MRVECILLRLDKFAVISWVNHRSGSVITDMHTYLGRERATIKLLWAYDRWELIA